MSFTFFKVALIGAFLLAIGQWGCSTFPEPSHSQYDFPKDQAFVETPEKKFKSLGVVRSKVNFQALDPSLSIDRLCRNYYNKSVKELVEFAERAGGDAVIEVRSVTFYMDGKMDLHKTAECSDDGEEGQILTRGIAVKWLE